MSALVAENEAQYLADYEKFWRDLAEHHRVGREKADRCLGDLVAILRNANPEEPKAAIMAVLDRLGAHYDVPSKPFR